MKMNSTSITALPRLAIYKAQDYPELKLKSLWRQHPRALEDSSVNPLPAVYSHGLLFPSEIPAFKADRHHFSENIHRAAQSQQIRVDPPGFIREGREECPFPAWPPPTSHNCQETNLMPNGTPHRIHQIPNTDLPECHLCLTATLWGLQMHSL